MPSATLRARLGVTAATLITATMMATGPALAAAASAAPTGSTPTPIPTATFDTLATGRAIEGVAQTPLVATNAQASGQATMMARHNYLVHKVLTEAQRQKGKPYIYGEDGPHGFDCSGLVRYVFLHSVHKSLPHNAAAQYSVLRHINRSKLRPGDLVFTDNGYISHVGIYDGHGYWWVAPHSGTHVQRQRIYHAHFLYARVLVLHKHLS
jgi:peptidoglycan DL-endopeptidase CwlO